MPSVDMAMEGTEYLVSRSKKVAACFCGDYSTPTPFPGSSLVPYFHPLLHGGAFAKCLGLLDVFLHHGAGCQLCFVLGAIC